jgi:TetR/AcrR family transcriptional regulator, regulator of autoinduction and epiphytic fitness
VATVAGVAKALVYYYFSTLDELFIAVLRASMDRFLTQMSVAAASGASLQTAWAYAGDQTGTANAPSGRAAR